MKSPSFLHHPLKRPFGVSVIILMLVLNVVFLAIALFASFEISIGELALWMMRTDDPTVIRILFFMIIFVEAAIAIGLWRLQRFAWVLIMIQTGLGMASDLWGYFHGYPSYTSMLIDIIIVFYLNQNEVQRTFSGTSRRGTEWTT